MTTGNLPGFEGNRIEESAYHAFGQYITRGPALPPEDGNLAGMEGVRSRLSLSVSAEHHEAAGWVAVEQAFVVAGNSGLRKKYPIDPFFEAAEESFTTALERHDPDTDPPAQLLQVELAMASLAIYAPWATREEIGSNTAAAFHEDIAEVGRGLLDLNDRLHESTPTSVESIKEANGLAAELIVMLAFNRRQSGELAIPSTLRQNKSVRKGTVGSATDTAQLRSNWDASVITRNGQARSPSDKLQVKHIITMPNNEQYGKQKQMYTDDITMVGVKDHILATVHGVEIWDALKILTGVAAGTTSSLKRQATAMSRELYAHILRDRRRREEAAV